MEQRDGHEMVWRTMRAFLILFTLSVGLITLFSFTGSTYWYRYTVYVAMIFAALLSIHYDKKDIAFLGISREGGLKNFCFGLTIGAASVIIVISGLILLGDPYFNYLFFKDSIPRLFLGGLVFNFLVAFGEGIFFRGYLISLFSEKMKPVKSLIVAAALFGICDTYFLLNVHWIEFCALVVALLCGLMFVNTRSLWMPLGFHFIFNSLQNSEVLWFLRGSSRILVLLVFLVDFILVIKFFPGGSREVMSWAGESSERE